MEGVSHLCRVHSSINRPMSGCKVGIGCWDLYLILIKICVLHVESAVVVLRVTNALLLFIPAALGRRK